MPFYNYYPTTQRVATEDWPSLVEKGILAPGTYEFPDAKFTINDNGKLEGPFKSFYKNGGPYLECNYKNGNLDGRYKRFYSWGDIFIHCTYKDGRLDDLYQRFDENPHLREYRFYKNGVQIW